MQELNASKSSTTTTLLVAIIFCLGAVTALPLAFDVRVPGQTAWYGARAAGMIAYLLATASVLFGMAIATRFGNKLLGKANIADTHRSLSLLSLIAIGAHTLFLALDSYASFSATDLMGPFATWYKPLWTGLGIIAAYLAIAVYASFYLRSLIGYKAWRTFHFAAFAVFGLGTIHGLFSGTDAGQTWALAIYLGCTAAVLAMLAYRISSRSSAPRERPVLKEVMPV